MENKDEFYLGMVTLSTVHIRPQTAAMIGADDESTEIRNWLPVYCKDDFGWFLYITDTDPADRSNWPEDLLKCVEFAESMGAGILCLDEDGPVAKELPSYREAWEEAE